MEQDLGQNLTNRFERKQVQGEKDEAFAQLQLHKKCSSGVSLTGTETPEKKAKLPSFYAVIGKDGTYKRTGIAGTDAEFMPKCFSGLGSIFAGNPVASKILSQKQVYRITEKGRAAITVGPHIFIEKGLESRYQRYFTPQNKGTPVAAYKMYNKVSALRAMLANETSHRLWYGMFAKANPPTSQRNAKVAFDAHLKGKDFLNIATGVPGLQIGNNEQANEFVSDAASFAEDPRDVFRILHPAFSKKPGYALSRNFMLAHVEKMLKGRASPAVVQDFMKELRAGKVTPQLLATKFGIGPEDLKPIQRAYVALARRITTRLAVVLRQKP